MQSSWAGPQCQQLPPLGWVIALQCWPVSACSCCQVSHHEWLQIRVFCRVKPHPKPALACLPDGFSVKAEVDGKEQVFQFDRVFGAASSQQMVFDEVAELVQSALDGFQVCPRQAVV